MLNSGPTTNFAVICQGVRKSFGDGEMRIEVLRGIDMHVRYGEMTLLVGPSGCGKTTLISIIAGLLDVTQGEVTVLNQSISKMSGRQKTRFRRDHIGFVFQQYNLLPSLTAAENASVPLIIAGVPRKEAVERAAAMLGQVGMADKVRSLPSQLSGGQQQRVAIARALVHEPQLLVCDEPTAALDGKSGRVVLELLKEIACRSDRAVIVVTHDNRIFHYGDRIVSMSDGQIDQVEDQVAGQAPWVGGS